MQPATWETALDWRFVQRLQQRLNQPGLLDRRYAEALVACHTSMGVLLDLAEKLNRRWHSLDEEMGSPVPIVYASPAANPPTHTVEKHQTSQRSSNTVIQRQSVVEKETAVPTSTLTPTPLPANSAPPNAPLPFVVMGKNDVRNTVLKPQQSAQQTRTLFLDVNRLTDSPANGKDGLKVGETAVSPPPSLPASALPLAAPHLPAVEAQLSLLQKREQAATRSTGGPVQSARIENRTPLPLVMAKPVMDLRVPVLDSRRADLPLAGKQVMGGGGETAVSTSPPSPTTNGAPKPPHWMQPQTHDQDTIPVTTPINIDNLVNKVEQQLFHRLTIERERRGKA